MVESEVADATRRRKSVEAECLRPRAVFHRQDRSHPM